MKKNSISKRIIILCALLVLLLIIAITAMAGTSNNQGESSMGADEEKNAENVGGVDGFSHENTEDDNQELLTQDTKEDKEGSEDNSNKENGTTNKDDGEETGTSDKDKEMNIYDIEPESVIDPNTIADTSDYFQSYTIETGDKTFDRIYGRSYQDNPYVGLSDLRYLRILHYDYSHQIRLGEMIVNANIADSVLSIFKTLFDNEYEIESIRLIDDFWTGDGTPSDDASIAANNTSAFCYRVISGGTHLSNHAYGYAIDVNPKQNPYYVIGSDGSYQDLYDWDYDYLDRTSGMAHMILKGDICESTFASYGFTWGGDWSNPVDYQHFEW